MMALGISLIVVGIGMLFLSFPGMLEDWKHHKRKKLLLLLNVLDVFTGPSAEITAFVFLSLLFIISGGVLIYMHIG